MKSERFRYKDPNSESAYNVVDFGNIIKSNPIESLFHFQLSVVDLIDKKLILAEFPDIPPKTLSHVLKKRAVEEFNTRLKTLIELKVPNSLVGLINAKKKKDQISLLKGLSITSEELQAFIIQSYKNHGFLYSLYKAEHLPKDIDDHKTPSFFTIDENEKVISSNDTNYSNGQLKHTINNRNVTISKFIELNNQWHCFILTYKSLGGRERYKNGKPHLHYISDKWGLSREEVLKQLLSKNYSLPSMPHIDFHTHRNPKPD